MGRKVGELVRIGKRARHVEGIFARMKKQHRKKSVFLALAEAAGIDRARAESHWAGPLARLEVADAKPDAGDE